MCYYGFKFILPIIWKFFILTCIAKVPYLINRISPKIECLGLKIPTKFGLCLLNFSREKFLKTTRIKSKRTHIWYDIWYYIIWYDMIWYDTIYVIWYGIMYDMIYMIWNTRGHTYDIILYYMIWYNIWYVIYVMIWYMIYDTFVNCSWVDTRWQ